MCLDIKCLFHFSLHLLFQICFHAMMKLGKGIAVPLLPQYTLMVRCWAAGIILTSPSHPDPIQFSVLLTAKWARKEDAPYHWFAPRSEEYVFEQLHFHWGQDDHSGSEHMLNNERRVTSVEIRQFHFGNLIVVNPFIDRAQLLP